LTEIEVGDYKVGGFSRYRFTKALDGMLSKLGTPVWTKVDGGQRLFSFGKGKRMQTK